MHHGWGANGLCGLQVTGRFLQAGLCCKFSLPRRLLPSEVVSERSPAFWVTVRGCQDEWWVGWTQLLLPACGIPEDVKRLCCGDVGIRNEVQTGVTKRGLLRWHYEKCLELVGYCSRTAVDVRIIHPAHVDLPYYYCLLLTAIKFLFLKRTLVPRCPHICHLILSSYQVADIYRRGSGLFRGATGLLLKCIVCQAQLKVN